MAHQQISYIKILLFAFLGLFTLSSCDPAMDLQIKVQNNSSEKLIVEFKGLHDYNKDSTVTLNIDEEVTVLNFSKWEKAKHYDCCPCEIGDLSIFTIDTSATSIKDYKNKDNWIKINENKSDVYCILDINDEDLE
jgi:hypothetical protein